jgi:NADH-quinone oxidoreductase subunit A
MMDVNTFGVILVFLVALTIPIVAMLLGRLLGPRRETEVKMAPFECGVDNTVGRSRQRFSVKFYIIALIFLVFDLEVIFLYPWAIDFRELNRALGFVVFIEMFIFLGILFLGYIYLFKKGALDWED